MYRAPFKFAMNCSQSRNVYSSCTCLNSPPPSMVTCTKGKKHCSSFTLVRAQDVAIRPPSICHIEQVCCNQRMLDQPELTCVSKRTCTAAPVTVLLVPIDLPAYRDFLVRLPSGY
ncbi:hypothetical protein CSKR_203414 [Clonorchis sinensis]|uniref:Uncharacterized protein n=1 Tax=Clonorchis sinensis TaxID=79923 RepID=A0A8T1MBU8_CLOSI|nr:hypothetical protein CSKR_203414 [Clonorchis sinensis]